MVTEIDRAAERASTLTQQLLSFARRQKLEPEIIDLNQSVRGVCEMLRRPIGEHIEMSLSVEPNLWPVEADVGQIEQVLVNLITNARDALSEGGYLFVETANVELDVEAAKNVSSRLAPGCYATISVRDGGIGMDEETLQAVFEPFFSTKEEGRGTGLGLAVAYGIVEQSGGHLMVESTLGEGSCFQVFLPRSMAEVASPQAEVDRASLRLGNERILLVEDETPVRHLIRTILQRSGYEVVDSGDPEVALTKCDLEIDLLVTDLVMPKMRGTELADRLRRRIPGLRVLFLSGYAEEIIRGELNEASFLSKPFTARALTRQVREVLDGQPVLESSIER
jgi:hypothetical protein